MTERERIELDIKTCTESVARTQRDLNWLQMRIREREAELAALPPDKPDLSAWRPQGIEEYFFIRANGAVSSGPVELGCGSSDYNYYRTREEAERAAKRQKLHTRLWQCHHRLYGAEGWEPGDNDTPYAIANISGALRVSSYGALPIGTAPFRTEKHAQWVIKQLQSEGLL